MRRDNKGQDIFWKKNGQEQAQRGNSYLVQLEESSGGGNYTCHNKDGSLLNHTVVLIQEDETERRKILAKTDQGTVWFIISQQFKLGMCLFNNISTHICLFLIRGLFKVLHSELQRRVPLLLDVAQQPRWESSIYQSSTVSLLTVEQFSVSLSNNNIVFTLISVLTVTVTSINSLHTL